jgi:hypothetical protein
MEQLLKYFMQETDKKLDELKDEVSTVRHKLEDIQKFKTELLATARTTSFIVSLICGTITIAITIVMFFK